MILLTMLLALSIMAQPVSETHSHYSDMFPKLTLPKVDMPPSLYIQSAMIPLFQSDGHQLMPPLGIGDTGSDAPQSLILRHFPAVDPEEAQKVQYRFTRGKQIYDNDALKSIRNDIVFKRMKKRQKVLAPIPNQR